MDKGFIHQCFRQLQKGLQVTFYKSNLKLFMDHLKTWEYRKSVKFAPVTLKFKTASFKDLKGIFDDRIYNIADLLGLENLYLNN